MSRAILLALLLWGLLAAPIRSAYGAPAQVPNPTASAGEPAPAPTEEKIASDSPRASLSEYLTACNDGQYALAAEFLELLPNEAARGPELARMLKAVLDRHLSIDLEAISGDSLGQRSDALAPNTDEIGKIARPTGKLDPVRLVRRQRANVDDVWV